MPSRRPTIVVLVLLAGAVVLCTALGVWQTRRLFERRRSNAAALARRTLPVVSLPSALPDTALQERRVRVVGRWDATHQLVLRAHVYNEIPGVEVATPIRPDSGPAILVLRGFVPALNGITPEVSIVPDTGLVTVEGIARRLPAVGRGGEPLRRPEGTTWRYLDSAGVADAVPYPVRPLVVRRSGPPTGWPRAVAETPLDDGPHLKYLLQWYSMAAIALATGLIIAFRREPPVAP